MKKRDTVQDIKARNAGTDPNEILALVDDAVREVRAEPRAKGKAPQFVSATRETEMTKRNRQLLPAIHPGEILFEEFMKPLGLSINRVARDLRVPVTRIADIVHGQRGVSSDTALRLARYFGTTPAFWMNLQSAYSLEVAEREAKEQIDRDVHPLNAAA